MELISTKPNAFLLSSSVVELTPLTQVSLTAISNQKNFSFTGVGAVFLKRQQRSVGFSFFRKTSDFLNIHFSRKG